jgi:hypothetical protein
MRDRDEVQRATLPIPHRRHLDDDGAAVQRSGLSMVQAQSYSHYAVEPTMVNRCQQD